MGIIIKSVKKKIVDRINNLLYRPMIRSRHPSHSRLRNEIKRLPFRSVIRFGSTTILNDLPSIRNERIELNPIEAIKNSSCKLRMKRCFTDFNVKTANWFTLSGIGGGYEIISYNNPNLNLDFATLEYPIISKSHFGSRGNGNKMHKSQKELQEWMIGKNLENYIFEKFVNYNKEYRLHCTKNGCFYSCRKMLKSEFKEHPNAWQRHDDNSVWILEENENFEKPNNWNEIVEHCVKAVESCGLDFGACDLRVQNNYDSEGNKRNNCDFIVIEVNSAPSFGDVTLEKYKEELPKLLIDKYDARNNN